MYKIYPLLVIFLMSFLVEENFLNAQDIQNILNAKPLEIGGSLNLSSTAYAANGVPVKRDPFTWIASGNLNLQVFSIDVPLSFSYTNRKAAFSQPFNRLSIAPSYKWIKTYIGYNSMQFSNYTLAGHEFWGAGVELTPGKWYIGFMKGRLREEVPFGSDSILNPAASFKRTGSGFKVGYTTSNSEISMNIFHASDKVTDLFLIPQKASITPMENTVGSIAGRQKIAEKLSLEGEFATSMLSTDIRNEAQTDANINSPLGWFMTYRSSTTVKHAWHGGITWSEELFSIQARVEQVDGGYQSLGAWYANNNFRNYTLMPTVNLFEGKLNLAANIGLQQDNLNNADDFTSSRWVGSFNVNTTLIEKWNMNGTYSNFTSFTKAKPLQDPFYTDEFDTLSFYQVSQTFSGSVSHQFGSTETPQGLSFNATYQQTGDHPAGNTSPSKIDLYTFNTMYTYSMPKTGTALQGGLNTFYNKMEIGSQFTFGPMAGISKTFLEAKLRGGLNTSYNKVWMEDSDQSTVLVSNLMMGYTPKAKEESKGKHMVNANFGFVKRYKSTLIPKSGELTFLISYSYGF